MGMYHKYSERRIHEDPRLFFQVFHKIFGDKMGKCEEDNSTEQWVHSGMTHGMNMNSNIIQLHI